MDNHTVDRQEGLSPNPRESQDFGQSSKRHATYYFAFVSVIALLYFGFILVIRPWGNFPIFDDWVYAKDCLRSAQTWHLVITHYESAWSLPQLLYGTLLVKGLGFSHWLLRCTNLGFIAATLLVFDIYLRRIQSHLVTRVVAVFTLAVHPFIIPQVFSFMTDIPFLFGWLAACYCWDRTLETRSNRWLMAATIVTMATLSQRQFGVFIPFSAMLLLLLENGISSQSLLSFVRIPPREFPARVTVSVFAICLFTCGILLAWFRFLHGYMVPLFVHQSIKQHMILTFVGTNSLALTCLPLLLVIGPAVRLVKRERIIFIAAFVAVLSLAALFLARGKFPLFNNIISEFGFLGENEVLLGQRPVIFGHLVNRVIILLACASCWFLLPRIVSLVHRGWAGGRQEASDPEMLLTNHHDAFGRVLLLSGLIYLVFILYRGLPVFDRYMLPVIPGVLFVAAKTSSGAPSFLRRASAFALLLSFAVVSATLTSDYYRWREAAWQGAEELMAQGVPAAMIQGGYEWNGWKVGTKPFPDPIITDYQYLISFSEIKGYTPVGTVHWRSIWGPHDRTIVMLRREPLSKPVGSQ